MLEKILDFLNSETNQKNSGETQLKKKCKVAVIGGGASGLATAKCLREDNHEPMIFESSDQIGGVWVYRQTSGGTFSTVHFQHSKYVSAFSDYPMSEDCQEFPHHTEVLKYLNNYADHFGLRECVKFNTKVDKITKKEDFWEVLTTSPAGQATYTFDAVAVCSGIYNEARWPDFPGEEEFHGTIIHSKNYKEPSIFAKKKVIVLGNGPSGVDIAVAASYQADKVIWSFRKKRWILPRYAGELPTDFIVNRLNKHIPFRHHFLSLVNINKFLPIILAHKWAKLVPDVPVEKSGPVFNEDALNRIRLGAIETKPNIFRFEKERVVFEDETSLEADIVVYATGYHINIPFLTSSVGEDHQKNLNLYKMVFHPELSNCAFIGFIYGNVVFPCSEMQARWFSKILSGEVSLPSKEEMWAEIQAYKKRQEEDWIPSVYRSLRVSVFEYMDDLASQINVLPKLWHHRSILGEIMAGPMISTQYRLDGSNRWQDAETWLKKIQKLARQ